jgi:hypothetical protein
LHFVYAYRIKDGIPVHKARLVAGGHCQEEGVHLDNYKCASPVLNATEVHMIFSLAAAEGLNLFLTDCTQAFINARISNSDLPVYVRQIQGESLSGLVYQLILYLYGCKQSPFFWHDERQVEVFFLKTGAPNVNEKGAIFIHRRGSSYIIHGVFC